MQEEEQFIPIWIKDARREDANAERTGSTRERTQLAAAKRQAPNTRGHGPQKHKLHRLRTARSCSQLKQGNKREVAMASRLAGIQRSRKKQ